MKDPPLENGPRTFNSPRAWGEPTEDSDIDLYVVTRDDFVPANYEERMQTHLKVSALLREINKSIPIGLMVHTKPMHQAFVRLDSMFARAVMTRGEVLYERKASTSRQSTP